MGLKEYRSKRKFKETPEPAGGGKRGRGLFVVQLHHASRRHYDFRLELDGTLKSWAVPKGPSFDPTVKRLAVEVEDHPISYAGFEGDIPEGHYGAGHVDIFDEGTWIPEGSAREGLAKGELKFSLQGDVLRGSWVLVRTRKQGRQQQWLLIKHDDEYAGKHEADDFVEADNDRPLAPSRRKHVWKNAKVSSRAVAKSPSRKPAGERIAGAKKKKDGIVSAGIPITHPDREVFPGTGITKGDVARYYEAVARWMLPEIAGRPLSVVRCPDGIGSACFFQKHRGRGWGDHVEAVAIREKSGKKDYLSISDERGLLELVQMNVLEFHPWGATAFDPDHADRIVFDLDPHAGVGWARVVAAARAMRRQLLSIGLESFLRTSGGKGLHVVVPLEPAEPWSVVKAFAQAMAQSMAEMSPAEFVAVAGEQHRRNRIFIDWLRNARGATSVASYSLRARATAGVAMPLSWQMLGKVESGSSYTLKNAPGMLRRRRNDPWEGLADIRQSLPKP